MSKKLINIGINAKKASKIKVDKKNKNKVLKKYLQLIDKNKKNILRENNKDIEFAIRNNLPENLISRLTLNDKKLTEIKASISKIIKLNDPTNKVIDKWKRPNGLIIKKVEGKFNKGDHIKILDKNFKEYARGLSSFSSEEINKIQGQHSNKIYELLGYISKSEVVHKDDMVEI